MRLTSICWFGMRPSRGETIINVHNPGPITFSHIISCPEPQFPSPDMRRASGVTGSRSQLYCSIFRFR